MLNMYVTRHRACAVDANGPTDPPMTEVITLPDPSVRVTRVGPGDGRICDAGDNAALDVDAAPAEDVAMKEATLTPKAGTRPRISLKFRGRTLGGHS